MTSHSGLSRREFVKMAGLATVGAREGGQWATIGSKRPRVAFVGVMGHGVHVYAIDRNGWWLQQVVASEAPVSLALHPSGESLYVLHEVSEYEGLPSGSVGTYKVDRNTGRLTLLGQQGLALSATMPRHLAVAPDGRSLVVAVHGGGAYNVLPIQADGQLGRVCGILKETGCGPNAEHQEAAHPQAILFDPSGKRVIAVDMGADRMSVLSLEDGLQVLARHEMQSGSGPRHIALHPVGHLLYVAHALDDSVCGFAYDSNAGKIMQQLVQVRARCAGALAIHPTGSFLYTAGSGEVTVWRIEIATGTLQRMQQQNVGMDEIRGMTVLADGRELLTLTAQGVLQMDIDAKTGRLGMPIRVAWATGTRCIAFL